MPVVTRVECEGLGKMWAVTGTPGAGERCFRGVVATMDAAGAGSEVKPAEHTRTHGDGAQQGPFTCAVRAVGAVDAVDFVHALQTRFLFAVPVDRAL